MVTTVEVGIRRTNVTADDIAAVRRVNIHIYTSNFAGTLSSVRYEHLSNRMVAYPHPAMDFFWKISPALSVDKPLWSGFMQMVHQGDHPQTS